MSGPTPDQNSAKPTPLGIYEQSGRKAISGYEITALLFALIWLVGSIVYFVLSPATVAGMQFLTTALVIFMPIAMVWVGTTTAKSARVMREESERLQTAIAAIRKAYVIQQQNTSIGPEPSVTRKLDEIAEAAKKTETALATFTTSRRETQRSTIAIEQPSAETAGDQGSLELGTQAQDLSPPLPAEDFIRALNFPETAEDEAGFAALRRALRDRNTAQLIQAAQDVLTLLSQDGIYMDDLRPDMARPEIWRAFAQGTRGRPVAALGGVRDRSSLALTSGRMKQDPIFRDAAHHFLRRFDQTFATFEPDANDAEISALGSTRTARAFMLLGRVAGTFD